MNRFYYIKHPEIFQGNHKLKYTSSYFEGWYFKISGIENSISFIPGISCSQKMKQSFIQVITNTRSFSVHFPFDDFHFETEPFSISIGNNFFSLDKIQLHLLSNNIHVEGTVNFEDRQEMNKSIFSPNIMGPFSYLSFMECNHAILSMKHNVKGNLVFNNLPFHFNNAYGYIEKDWGTSFPKHYIWGQANTFLDSSTSLFVSVANIPFGPFHFNGFICVLFHKGKEYRFTTYNNSKLTFCDIKNHTFSLCFSKKDFQLYIDANMDNGFKLLAPKLGNMAHSILENIHADLRIKFMYKNNLIFEDSCNRAGMEIVR